MIDYVAFEVKDINSNKSIYYYGIDSSIKRSHNHCSSEEEGQSDDDDVVDLVVGG